MNYFELFAIEQKYDIDQKLLQKQYFSLQTKYHPDRSKNELERSENLEYSMLINEAFKILSHDQLEEILNNYELIEELQDLPQLYAAAQDKIEDCQKLVHEIGISFRENNIKQALDLTVKLKYLTNLVGNIKLKIKNADN